MRHVAVFFVLWILFMILVVVVVEQVGAHYDSQDLWHWLPEVLNEPWDGVWE